MKLDDTVDKVGRKAVASFEGRSEVVGRRGAKWKT
jgi:hypothetical protein